MENVGFYTTLTRASNVSLSDSSVLSFFSFFLSFGCCRSLSGGGGEDDAYRQIFCGCSPYL